MKPSDFAIEELALWERALKEQHQAEERLMGAHTTVVGPALSELVEQVQELRTKTDLLLAETARIKALYRDARDGFAELASPGAETQRGEGAWLWPRLPPGASS
jgi:hypothetical protein